MGWACLRKSVRGSGLWSRTRRCVSVCLLYTLTVTWSRVCVAYSLLAVLLVTPLHCQRDVWLYLPLPSPALPFPSSHQPSEGYGVLQTASGPLLVTNMTAYLHDGSRTVPHHHQQQQQQHSNATDRALRWDEGWGGEGRVRRGGEQG